MSLGANVVWLLRGAAAGIVTGARYIQKTNPIFFVYAVLVYVGINLTAEVHHFRKELNDFRGSVVYDIDKVRAQYLSEMNYIYMAGCRTGIDYPDEYRLNQTSFNNHSPAIYCNDEKEKLDDYIYEQLRTIGR